MSRRAARREAARRRQRGSVLSAVIIITAFVAILAGALSTEVSTNFLLSRALMHRVNDEATVSSAAEVALAQMEGTPISAGCPAPITATLNNLTAATSYLSCAPTVDSRSSAYQQLGSGAAINVDSTFANNSFIVGDSAGNVTRYTYPASSRTVGLGGSVTGPILAMPNSAAVIVPASNATAPAANSCAGTCLAQLDFSESTPDCYMNTGDTVTARPAAGVNFPALAYAGDHSGGVYAFDAFFQTCFQLDSVQSDTTQPVIGSVIAFAGIASKKTTADEIFLVQSDGSGSQISQVEMLQTRRGVNLSFVQDWNLARPNAVGVTYDTSTLPARAAITYAGGWVQIVQISSSLGVSVQSPRQLPSALADAPTWCCGAAPTRLGIGGQNGTFYLLDGALNLVASYSLGGSLERSPDVDAAGDWFVGSDDGNVYEVPSLASTPFTPTVFGGGQLGRIRGGVQVAPCNGTWLCAYAASQQGGVYRVDLSARQVAIFACITVSPPTCSGENPRLWVSAEVGSVGSNSMIHVQGWSYYSP